jgi:ABC-2 type transport system ATP-binding protein
LCLRIAEPERAADTVRILVESGISIDSYSFGQPSLDEVFMTITGHAVAAPGTKEAK